MADDKKGPREGLYVTEKSVGDNLVDRTVGIHSDDGRALPSARSGVVVGDAGDTVASAHETTLSAKVLKHLLVRYLAVFSSVSGKVNVVTPPGPFTILP